MRMERYLTCYYCHYVRSSGDYGRPFDEVDPFGAPDQRGDPTLVCQPCIDSAHSQCECCGAYEPIPKMPFESRNGMGYCDKCWDAGCDLVECSRTPELPPIQRKLRHKRDKFGNVIKEPAFPRDLRPGSENVGPTEEELAATYKSLGFEYHMNYKPEEGKQ